MLNKATVTGLLALNAQVPEALFETLSIPRAILRLEAGIYACYHLLVKQTSWVY